MGVVAVIISLLIAAESLVISSPWLTQVAAVGLVIAWMLLRAGSVPWQTTIALSSLLILTVPLPAGYDDKLIQLLQAKSSQAASFILDLLRIVHLPEGNVLNITKKKLFVDEACSGVDSLYALMAICLTILLWFRQRFIVAVISLCFVPMWASCSNILRLVIIAVGIDRFDIDLSHGTSHTILGLCVFAIAFLCDYSFIRFIGELCEDKTPEDPFLAESRMVYPVRTIRPGVMRWVGCALLLLVSGSLAFYGSKALALNSLHRLPRFTEESLTQVKAAQELPKSIGPWQFDSFKVVERNRESAFGQFSHVWLYRSPSGLVTISADFPFRGFHLLDICYQGAGWRLKEPSKQFDLPMLGQTGEVKDFSVHTISMKNDEGTQAFVAYTLFQLDGNPIRSRANAVRGLERFEQTVFEPVSFQIQVMLNSLQEIPDEDQQIVLKGLQELVQVLRPTFSVLEAKD